MAEQEKTKRTPSEITLKAQALLDGAMTINATPSLYIAGYRSRIGKHLALERCRDSIFVWTEAVSGKASESILRNHVRSYTKDKSRNSNLNQKNASRLMNGNPVDYWRFDHIADLQNFVDWYHEQ